ncbi:hypothetical protein EVAR_74041_1 [Eumeta japonica]|uniref:Uncharacterized protein n=1 Tax=Eumeta variegata TaxID=151549 RepID=A0A4C1ST24_EUMVA|nr:hypothetical protein EVAR_74041_1 [Eumeta japonica]
MSFTSYLRNRAEVNGVALSVTIVRGNPNRPNISLSRRNTGSVPAPSASRAHSTHLECASTTTRWCRPPHLAYPNERVPTVARVRPGASGARLAGRSAAHAPHAPTAPRCPHLSRATRTYGALRLSLYYAEM